MNKYCFILFFQSIFALASWVKFFLFIKLTCDSRFQRAFTACSCDFKIITLVVSNQDNYFENVTACSNARWKHVSQRTLKTRAATQLNYSNFSLQKLTLCRVIKWLYFKEVKAEFRTVKSCENKSCQTIKRRTLETSGKRIIRYSCVSKWPKVALQRAFYACVYCMQLRFQSNYLDWLKPR